MNYDRVDNEIKDMGWGSVHDLVLHILNCPDIDIVERRSSSINVYIGVRVINIS